MFTDAAPAAGDLLCDASLDASAATGADAIRRRRHCSRRERRSARRPAWRAIPAGGRPAIEPTRLLPHLVARRAAASFAVEWTDGGGHVAHRPGFLDPRRRKSPRRSKRGAVRAIVAAGADLRDARLRRTDPGGRAAGTAARRRLSSDTRHRDARKRRTRRCGRAWARSRWRRPLAAAGLSLDGGLAFVTVRRAAPRCVRRLALARTGAGLGIQRHAAGRAPGAAQRVHRCRHAAGARRDRRHCRRADRGAAGRSRRVPPRRQTCRAALRDRRFECLGHSRPTDVRGHPPSGRSGSPIPRPGVLEGFEAARLARRAPAAHEVEIEVHATSLNFMNVMSAMGMYPGYPNGVGPSVSNAPAA